LFETYVIFVCLGGGDPHIPDRDGQLPYHVASNNTVKKILENVTTDQAVAWKENLEYKREKLKRARREKLEATTKDIKTEMEELVKKAELAGQQLSEAATKLQGKNLKTTN